MKIIHIAECAGGVERYLQMLMPLLKEKGVEQVLICSQNYRIPNFDGIADKFYQINIQQSFSPITVIYAVIEIRKILKTEKGDIVYSHSSFGGTLARLASLGLKYKNVYNPHGWSFNAQNVSPTKIKVYTFIEKLFANLTDKIITISQYEKRYALQLGICNEDKIIVIKSGLEVEKYTSIKKYADRQMLGIPSSANVIGMVGRLTEGKSPDIFVHMAAILKKKIPNSFFVIVGEGEMHAEIQKLIDSFNLHNSFLITGWIDNVADYIHAFDIALLLTKWEGFGLAVAEYMINKRPFISTYAGGIPDIVKNEWNGLLIESIDEQSAANAVIRIYKDKELSTTMVKNGYEYAIKELDVRRTAEEHYQLFNNLMTSKRPFFTSLK